MIFCDALNKLPGKEDNGLFGKNFLRTWDMSDDDIKAVAVGACALKTLRDDNISPKIFDSGIAVSMFSKVGVSCSRVVTWTVRPGIPFSPLYMGTGLGLRMVWGSRRARRAVSWFSTSRRMALMAAAEMVRPGSTWVRTSTQR